jgi:hypothetical protein
MNNNHNKIHKSVLIINMIIRFSFIMICISSFELLFVAFLLIGCVLVDVDDGLWRRLIT